MNEFIGSAADAGCYHLYGSILPASFQQQLASCLVMLQCDL
jgi:hypothetical protein